MVVGGVGEEMTDRQKCCEETEGRQPPSAVSGIQSLMTGEQTNN